MRKTFEHCQEIREGVGKDGDWAIDYHTRLDMPDAVRLSTLIEPLEPYFCEDLVRSENPGVYRELRQQVKVPIAVGEQFGDRWDTNELIEQHLIDYTRVTHPQRRRHHRVHEDRRAVRDALRGPGAALHRAGFGGRAGALLRRVFRARR